jgi:hypothetical protein
MTTELNSWRHVCDRLCDDGLHVDRLVGPDTMAPANVRYLLQSEWSDVTDIGLVNIGRDQLLGKQANFLVWWRGRV